MVRAREVNERAPWDRRAPVNSLLLHPPLFPFHTERKRRLCSRESENSLGVEIKQKEGRPRCSHSWSSQLCKQME